MDSQSCCLRMLGGTLGLGTALTGVLRMQQEENRAAAALGLLAPRPLILWRPAGQLRSCGSMRGLWKENGGQHLAGNPLSTSAPSPPRGAPAFEVFKDMRDAQNFRAVLSLSIQLLFTAEYFSPRRANRESMRSPKCVERRCSRQHQRSCMCTDCKQADTMVLLYVHAANGSGKPLRRHQRETQRVL